MMSVSSYFIIVQQLPLRSGVVTAGPPLSRSRRIMPGHEDQKGSFYWPNNLPVGRDGVKNVRVMASAFAFMTKAASGIFRK
jgi:hypothetical protein